MDMGHAFPRLLHGGLAVNYIIPALVIGAAIYAVLMLLALGLSSSSSMSDEELERAYRNLREGR